VRRLAAARDAAPRQVLGGVAPRDVDHVPRHADHLRRHALAVRPGFSAKIADASLDGHAAVRLDDEQPIEADRTGAVRADRDATAAHLRSLALPAPTLALIPVEDLRSFVERLLDETAGRVGPLTARIRRAESGFAGRRIDPPDLDLIDPELACRLGDHRLHQDDALHAARLALRAARWRVGNRGDAAPTHRLGLEQQ